MKGGFSYPGHLVFEKGPAACSTYAALERTLRKAASTDLFILLLRQLWAAAQPENRREVRRKHRSNKASDYRIKMIPKNNTHA